MKQFTKEAKEKPPDAADDAEDAFEGEDSFERAAIIQGFADSLQKAAAYELDLASIDGKLFRAETKRGATRRR